MDYEKAFDFMNREILIKKMVDQNIGKRFVAALAQMYSFTAYTPKESNTTLGMGIETKHGLTQGKNSSANFYSFYVSDMPDALKEMIDDFMDPFNLAQLADDTATLASKLESLRKRIIALLEYSKENNQTANIDKTKYLHLSDNPTTEPIRIDELRQIGSAHKDGYNYLGMLFIASNLLKDQIMKNLNKKMINIHKFYAWLEHNINTPIKVKLTVFYNCALAALLYGVEAWWNIDAFREKILLIERKGLKRCLGVKSSTPNDIVYIELNKADIISNILDKQYNFFQKISNLSEDEAVVKNIVNMCAHLDIVKHYQELTNTNKEDNLTQKKHDVSRSTETMKQRYYSLTNNTYCEPIYETFITEEHRILLTRWRLSCFDLKIETGRYNGTPREERLCSLCNQIEDEQHVLFDCRAYDSIRTQFTTLFENNPTLHDLLNPRNRGVAEETGLLLKLIEDRRSDILT